MITALIFDMDGTLYKSNTIRQKFAEAAYHTLAVEKSLSAEKARHDIENKRQHMKSEYGDSVPYTLTLRTFGISIQTWHECNIAYFDPRDYLKPDLVLRKTLVELKERYTLAVLTNNNATQTQRTLEGIKIDDVFDCVFTFNSFTTLKPDPAFFLRAAEYMKLTPTACCYIGDRYEVDLKPAKEIGMKTLKVKGPEDLYDLPRWLEEGDL